MGVGSWLKSQVSKVAEKLIATKFVPTAAEGAARRKQVFGTESKTVATAGVLAGAALLYTGGAAVGAGGLAARTVARKAITDLGSKTLGVVGSTAKKAGSYAISSPANFVKSTAIVGLGSVAGIPIIKGVWKGSRAVGKSVASSLEQTGSIDWKDAAKAGGIIIGAGAVGAGAVAAYDYFKNKNKDLSGNTVLGGGNTTGFASGSPVTPETTSLMPVTSTNGRLTRSRRSVKKQNIIQRVNVNVINNSRVGIARTKRYIYN